MNLHPHMGGGGQYYFPSLSYVTSIKDVIT